MSTAKMDSKRRIVLPSGQPGDVFDIQEQGDDVGVVAGDGAAINAVSLAELCVGDDAPESVAIRVRSWGIAIVDVPAAASGACASAYRQNREARLAESGKGAPALPLPDFYLGAHAQMMGRDLATADQGRFRKYFPKLTIRIPQ